MKIKRIFGYLALLIVPIVAACSVGKDNAVAYFISGNLRGAFLRELTQNYWVNFEKNEMQKTENMKKVYEALLKETGIGVTLSVLKIDHTLTNGVVKEVNRGTGTDETTRSFYDCQPRKPENLTEEEKKATGAPKLQDCNENHKEIKEVLDNSGTFYFYITYEGSEYATSAIPHKKQISFCVATNYSYDEKSKLIANITEFKDAPC